MYVRHDYAHFQEYNLITKEIRDIIKLYVTMKLVYTVEYILIVWDTFITIFKEVEEVIDF